MSLTPSGTAHVLLALVVLATCAHGVGHVFKRLRQPQVIGEIVGGLLLGPTVLGRISPEAQHWLLPPGRSHRRGARRLLPGSDCCCSSGSPAANCAPATPARSAAPSGPWPCRGWYCRSPAAWPSPRCWIRANCPGRPGHRPPWPLVFGMAIAITSVPVISRIMLDLDVLGTRFSRIVLAVAVVEDVVLYVILAIVLGVAQAETSDPHGLWSLIGTDSLPWPSSTSRPYPWSSWWSPRTGGRACSRRCRAAPSTC
ncbi:cation:proton antiporter [Streptomyces tricolor]|nr:cation:proton antiporter [Streptomyces tricolor]